MREFMKLEDVKISCVVCTLHGPATIDDLFDSLLAQEWIDGDELVVIDNGMSGERRAQIEQRLREFTARGISAHRHLEPQKSAVRARLKWIEVSGNAWLFSLDDDNILEPGALRQTRRRILENPALGGICPRIEPLWQVKPKPWVVALGHQVLSYNASGLHSAAQEWQLWPAGAVGPRPPTGGMIIAKIVAEDFARLCRRVPIILSFTPAGRRRFTGDDFILYSLIYMRGNLLTAYDDAIVVRHQIPPHRTTLSYLLETMFWSNYCFGLQGLMRFGKSRVLYVLVRGLGRLSFRNHRRPGKPRVPSNSYRSVRIALRRFLLFSPG
jgi:glycosyltransferase involved in cell wall biosynthesis